MSIGTQNEEEEEKIDEKEYIRENMLEMIKTRDLQKKKKKKRRINKVKKKKMKGWEKGNVGELLYKDWITACASRPGQSGSSRP